MRVAIRNVTSRQEEQVVLECVALTPDFEDIRNYCLSKEKSLIGMIGSMQRPVYYDEILYIEAVDEKTFRIPRPASLNCAYGCISWKNSCAVRNLSGVPKRF